MKIVRVAVPRAVTQREAVRKVDLIGRWGIEYPGMGERAVKVKGERLTEQECLKRKVIGESKEGRIIVKLSRIPYPPCKLPTQHRKHCERADLEGEPRNHDMDAQLILAIGVSARSDRPARRLQEQRDEITRNERDSVGAGTNARVLGAVDDDDAREAEVDGSGEEGGADGEDDEVH